MRMNPSAIIIWMTLAFATVVLLIAGVSLWWIPLALMGAYTVYAVL